MTGIKYMLDTNIVIGLFNRNSAVLELVAKHNISDLRVCAISIVTRMELLSYHRITEQEMIYIEKQLNLMTCFKIDSSIEEQTIRYRRLNRGKLPDAIIAATAQINQLPLLTIDKKLAGNL